MTDGQEQKLHNAEECCGTTADKLRTLRYIKTLELDNKRLRSDKKALERLTNDLMRQMKDAGFVRRYDS